ncbi:hypothetical protein HGB25_01415 [Candidatus Saccharibacteria bacterium]|nr:hypothetical protein [Candidatus Saccharibacteria bacterium]
MSDEIATNTQTSNDLSAVTVPNKKRPLIKIIVGVCIVASILVAGFFVYKTYFDNSDRGSSPTTTKATADKLKADATAALLANDKTRAKSLFIKANEQYKTLGDKNNQIDTDAQIYLIEHTK